MQNRHTPTILHRLGVLQAKHPWKLIAVALLTLIPAVYAIVGNGGLGFKSSFSELLPDNKPSVIEARRVAKRMPGAATLTVVAQIRGGSNPKALERFVDTLVPRLKQLGPSKVGSVDYGVKATRKFFQQNELMYANIEDLKKAHDEILERYDYEVAKAQGNLLDDDEEDAPAPLTAASIEHRLANAKNKVRSSGPSYPDGYYMNEQGSLIAVLIKTPVSGKKNKAAFRKQVESVVASVDPTSFDPRMEVNYTGNFITSAEEYNRVIGDLMHVGGWGVAGVLAAVLLFFLRARTVFALGSTILIGLAWTFGLTRLSIGYLNSSTGFLVSIIAGNGINYGIMYMARYMEARRDEAADVATAIQVAHRDTWLPTLAGSATAMLAYGSLILTDFRGFKHFGIISGYGMVLCWVATFAFLPAILSASERMLPSYTGRSSSKLRGYYGLAFAKLSRMAPRTIALVGAAASVLAVAGSVAYLASDPMEYDLANVRNARTERTSAGLLSVQVDKVVGRMGQDGMAIMTDRIDQVPMLAKELQKRYDAAPADKKPFEKVVTIYSLIPKHQQEKIRLIEEMRDRIQRAHSHGFIAAEDWKKLAPHMPVGALHPIHIEDLPPKVARPFTERDGSRGKIVYIVPKEGFSVWDAHYLMRWADSFRETTLPNGEVILGSGSAVIFSDMLITVNEDAPKAILFSALGSVLVILIAFRFRREALGVFLPWLGGVASLLAFLYVADIKLNFLNFVTLPITIGISAEYAHNLMQRYRNEGPENLDRIIRETGGAVILCSLTTTLGYLALTLSINRGIVSFGLSAAVGEVTSVLAAVLFLPATLYWLNARKAKKLAAAQAKKVRQLNRPSSSGVGVPSPATL